ncbi:hypothetical protein L227DRAFT_630426, partial [Lentinus tigrinus ALCF2SS1-6]
MKHMLLLTRHSTRIDDDHRMPWTSGLPRPLRRLTDPRRCSTQARKSQMAQTMTPIVHHSILQTLTSRRLRNPPLVDLWFKLTDHLSEETIPNP